MHHFITFNDKHLNHLTGDLNLGFHIHLGPSNFNLSLLSKLEIYAKHGNPSFQINGIFLCLLIHSYFDIEQNGENIPSRNQKSPNRHGKHVNQLRTITRIKNARQVTNFSLQ